MSYVRLFKLAYCSYLVSELVSSVVFVCLADLFSQLGLVSLLVYAVSYISLVG